MRPLRLLTVHGPRGVRNLHQNGARCYTELRTNSVRGLLRLVVTWHVKRARHSARPSLRCAAPLLNSATRRVEHSNRMVQLSHPVTSAPRLCGPEENPSGWSPALHRGTSPLEFLHGSSPMHLLRAIPLCGSRPNSHRCRQYILLPAL